MINGRQKDEQNDEEESRANRRENIRLEKL